MEKTILPFIKDNDRYYLYTNINGTILLKTLVHDITTPDIVDNYLPLTNTKGEYIQENLIRNQDIFNNYYTRQVVMSRMISFNVEHDYERVLLTSSNPDINDLLVTLFYSGNKVNIKLYKVSDLVLVGNGDESHLVEFLKVFSWVGPVSEIKHNVATIPTTIYKRAIEIVTNELINVILA